MAWKPWKTRDEAASQSGVGSFTTPVGGNNDGFSWFGQGGSGAVNKHDVVGKSLDAINPSAKAAAAAKKKREEDKAREAAKIEALKGVNQGYTNADMGYKTAFDAASKEYLTNTGASVGEYKGKINELNSKAESQANDHTANYTNTILPAYKDAMEMQQKNAQGAMTLEEAMDPNNPLATKIRELYDQLGQTERMRGQQDYGVLSALGAQAAQGQFGMSGPMTSGAMGQIYAANQRQAGDAYARAQQRMYDLQQQGIERGFDDTKHWYSEGQKARDSYGNSIKDLQQGEMNYYDTQGKFRDEMGGYAGDILGVDSAYNADVYNMGMTGAGIDKENAYAGLGREGSMINQEYGGQQTLADADLDAEMKGREGEAKFLSSIAQMFASRMSDERRKRNISDISDDELDEFLEALQPKSFDYKDENELGALPGRRVGFMLQDLEGTKLGDQMTFEAPNGNLMYDQDNLTGILLAALKRQHEKDKAA